MYKCYSFVLFWNILTKNHDNGYPRKKLNSFRCNFKIMELKTLCSIVLILLYHKNFIDVTIYIQQLVKLKFEITPFYIHIKQGI